MMTVRQDAEYKMKDMLDALRDNRSSWRALVFRISLLRGQAYTTGISRIAYGLVTNHLAEHEGTVFVCGDEDMVVLCKAVTRRDYEDIVSSFITHIADKIRQTLSSPLTDMFDLGVSWDAMTALVASKLAGHKARLESGLFTPIQEQGFKPTLQAASRDDLYTRRLNRPRAQVLLVEDEAMSLHLARKTLMMDYVVFTATNGEEAQRAYLAYAPDIVFLDIGLPDMDGHAVMEKLLAIDPTAFIVMLSGNSYRQEIMKAMDGGAKGFVAKPFSKAKLYQYVSQAPTATALSTPH